MHDPTEGGILTALWELAEASGHGLLVEPEAIPILPLAGRLCAALGLDPLATISSGALLLAVPPGENAEAICAALQLDGIACQDIGSVVAGEPGVWQESGDGRRLLPRPSRDELARLLEQQEGIVARLRSDEQREKVEP
jgi:hydrogenase maturation factor